MKFIIIVVILFLSKIAISQKSDIGNWLIYFGNQKLNSKFNWHNEIQYRSYNLIDDANQLLLRTGLGCNLTENNNNLLLGYAYINTQNYIATSNDKISINEHRIYQQFITRQNFGRVFIQHRYRAEQRFFTDNFLIRMRYFLGVNIPITKKTMETNALYLSSYNELFIDTKAFKLERNRLYGALGYVINKNIKIELGFMAQSLKKTNRNQFQIVIFNNISFAKN